MPTSISIGFSQDPNPQHAILQACVQVKKELDTAENDLVIVFASPSYIIPDTQTIISRTLKPKRLVGSSTGGIILSKGVANRGIAIIGINSDELHFGVSAIKDINNEDMHYTGFDLARKATYDLNTPHKEVFIIFSEGIERNSTQFIRGVKEVLGSGFPVIGAVSSDDFKYKRLSQLFQDQILKNSVVGLLLGGSFHLALGCKHSFKPLGKPRIVTNMDGPVIRTIDHKAAIDIYKHFLGPEVENIKNIPLNSHAAMYPLGFYQEESGQYLLRNVIDILADGSIVCQEGIPLGAEVHLMISDQESCQNAAIQAAEFVKVSLGEKPAKLVLLFESLTRQKVLGRGAWGEIQAIKKILGPSTPLVGMCSYGEMGPFDTLVNIKNIYLHNESILIVAIS